MDNSPSAGSGTSHRHFPRLQSKKALSARISQLEAKIQSAGGGMSRSPSTIDTHSEANPPSSSTQLITRTNGLEAQTDDIATLRQVAAQSLQLAEELRAENNQVTDSLQAVRLQLADQRVRAESAEAQVKELDHKVANLASQNAALQAKYDSLQISHQQSLNELNILKEKYQLALANSAGNQPNTHQNDAKPRSNTTAPPLSSKAKGNQQEIKEGHLEEKQGQKEQQGQDEQQVKSSYETTTFNEPNSTKGLHNPPHSLVPAIEMIKHEVVSESSSPLSSSPASYSPKTPKSQHNDQDSNDQEHSQQTQNIAEIEASESTSKKKKDKKSKKLSSSSSSISSLTKDDANADLKMSPLESPSKKKSKSKAKDLSSVEKNLDYSNVNDIDDEPSQESVTRSTATKRSTNNPFRRSSKTVQDSNSGDDASVSTTSKQTDQKADQDSHSKRGRARSEAEVLVAQSDTEAFLHGKSPVDNPRMAIWSDVTANPKDKKRKKGGVDVLALGGDASSLPRTTSAQVISSNKTPSSGGDYSSLGSTQIRRGMTSANSKQTLTTKETKQGKEGKEGKETKDVSTKKSDSIAGKSSKSSSHLQSRSYGVNSEDIATDVEGIGGRKPKRNAGYEMSVFEPILPGSKGKSKFGSARSGSKKRGSIDLEENHEGSYQKPGEDFHEVKLKPTVVGNTLKKKKNKSTPYGVAFGVRRGACDPPCDCTVYQKKEDSFACKTCSHFPAQHNDLGRVSEDEEEPSQQNTSSANGNTEVAVVENAKPPSPGRARIAEDSSTVPSHHMKAAPLDIVLETASAIDPHWVLDFSDCFFVNQLGKGNSSTVFLGSYKNQQVAIKVLRQETHKRDLEDFKKEMEIMSSLRSPYIVHFYGATLTPKLCIILEYCSRGTLFHYLHDDKNYVDWKMALRWMLESVRGINTLHLWKPQIVHRDLKTLNLLLDDKMKIKVCDFGLSRFVSGEHDQSTFFKMRGTFAYFAPEVYQGKPFTSKSDIYSIGIILWELIHRIILGSHTRPFAEYKQITHDFQIIIQAAKGVRPTLPLSTPRLLVKLYDDCVAPDPDQRPTCEEIIERLEQITQFYEEHADIWDPLVKGGVRTRAPVVRRDSTNSATRSSASSNRSPGRASPGRGELVRTGIGSRTLFEDLARRGVSPALLKKDKASPALSASSSSLPPSDNDESLEFPKVVVRASQGSASSEGVVEPTSNEPNKDIVVPSEPEPTTDNANK